MKTKADFAAFVATARAAITKKQAIIEKCKNTSLMLKDAFYQVLNVAYLNLFYIGIEHVIFDRALSYTLETLNQASFYQTRLQALCSTFEQELLSSESFVDQSAPGLDGVKSRIIALKNEIDAAFSFFNAATCATRATMTNCLLPNLQRALDMAHTLEAPLVSEIQNANENLSSLPDTWKFIIETQTTSLFIGNIGYFYTQSKISLKEITDYLASTESADIQHIESNMGRLKNNIENYANCLAKALEKKTKIAENFAAARTGIIRNPDTHFSLKIANILFAEKSQTISQPEPIHHADAVPDISSHPNFTGNDFFNCIDADHNPSTPAANNLSLSRLARQSLLSKQPSFFGSTPEKGDNPLPHPAGNSLDNEPEHQGPTYFRP